MFDIRFQSALLIDLSYDFKWNSNQDLLEHKSDIVHKSLNKFHNHS